MLYLFVEIFPSPNKDPIIICSSIGVKTYSSEIVNSFKYISTNRVSKFKSSDISSTVFPAFCNDLILSFSISVLYLKFLDSFKSLCNLDGGGSRALLWMGKWIYTSSRTPYNAIAIWLEDGNDIEIGDGNLKVKCKKKTSVYKRLFSDIFVGS